MLHRKPAFQPDGRAFRKPNLQLTTGSASDSVCVTANKMLGAIMLRGVLDPNAWGLAPSAFSSPKGARGKMG